MVREELDQLPGQLAAARERAAALLHHQGSTSGSETPLATPVRAAAAHALPLMKHALEVGTAVVLVIMLGFFFASSRDALRLGVRRLVPRRQRAHRPRPVSRRHRCARPARPHHLLRHVRALERRLGKS
jgi:predicted PurR-regulated permease PerM